MRLPQKSDYSISFCPKCTLNLADAWGKDAGSHVKPGSPERRPSNLPLIHSRLLQLALR